jgi:hypothetical protein
MRTFRTYGLLSDPMSFMVEQPARDRFLVRRLRFISF